MNKAKEMGEIDAEAESYVEHVKTCVEETYDKLNDGLLEPRELLFLGVSDDHEVGSASIEMRIHKEGWKNFKVKYLNFDTSFVSEKGLEKRLKEKKEELAKILIQVSFDIAEEVWDE